MTRESWRRPSRVAVLLPGIALALAAATEVRAFRPRMPQLDDLAFEGSRVCFRQPDGTATTLDVRTGAVLERGGKLPDDWSRPRECSEHRDRICALAGGTLAFDGHELAFERGPGLAGWKAVHRPYTSLSLRRLVEVEGTLLMESSSAAMGTLEGVDTASGRSLWIYAYPSPGYGPWSGTEAVARARKTLLDFQEYASFAPIGTQDLVAARTDERYRGTVILDPDPLAARRVGRQILQGWIGLVVIMAALAAVILRSTPGGTRNVLLAIVTAALGILTVQTGHLHTALTVSLWVGFLACSIAAGRDKRRPFAARLLLWMITAATAFLFFMPWLFWTVVR